MMSNAGSPESEGLIVVQLPLGETSDFDALIDLEDALRLALSRNDLAKVVGHDLGEERFNLFIVPGGPMQRVIEQVRATLERQASLDAATIAAREERDGQLVVVWPEIHVGRFRV